jgi:putative membrane protein (TIGR04086 family)
MKDFVIQVAKAVCGAVICSLVLVLLFTLTIQLFSITTTIVKPVNQVLKIISVFVGGLLFIRQDRGLIKGVIFGIIAVIITYFLYSAIAGSLTFSWKFLIEILLGAVAGGISGVVGVNIIKQAKS